MLDAARTTAVLAATIAALGPAGPAGAQERAATYPDDVIDARIWLDRGERPLVHRGDRVRLYYRTAADAYVAIFHIDTDGGVRLLHPRSPAEDHYVRGGRDYRLLFPRSSYWHVDDAPGLGYFFIVASRRPMDFSRLRYAHRGGGWDLSRVGRTVYRDPYLAMDDYVAELVPDWEHAVYSLHVAEYHVDRVYRYPRFLCYDCHAFRPYRSWNPYYYRCRSFRVVIYTDPVFYPVRRYGPRRVVYTGVRLRDRARFSFKERAAGEAGTPVVRRRAKPRSNAAAVPGAPRRTAGETTPPAVRPPDARRGPEGRAGDGERRAPALRGSSPRAPATGERERSGPTVRPPASRSPDARPADRERDEGRPNGLRRPSDVLGERGRARLRREGDADLPGSGTVRSRGDRDARVRRPDPGRDAGIRSPGARRPPVGGGQSDPGERPSVGRRSRPFLQPRSREPARPEVRPKAGPGSGGEPPRIRRRGGPGGGAAVRGGGDRRPTVRPGGVRGGDARDGARVRPPARKKPPPPVRKKKPPPPS